MKPVLQALVLAERIYTDKGSGKKIIAGTFNCIDFGPVEKKERELPDGSRQRLVAGGTEMGSPSVYLSLTDVIDGTQLSLQFVNVSKNRIVFGIDFKIACKNRLATVEIVLPLPSLRPALHESGTFSFDVIWSGEILGSHRIQGKRTSILLANRHLWQLPRDLHSDNATPLSVT